MVEIKQIVFKNYRQYKDVTINFDDESDNKLHVLRAKNGTGKTTFLNGILWCLYEKELYMNNEQTALKVINEGIVQDANAGDEVRVSVTIKISDNDDFIYFERVQKFKINYNSLNNNMKIAESSGKTYFTITKTTKNGNTEVLEDDERTTELLRQYFDESIYNYYFFDGENLRDYFNKNKSENVKNSIFNISQVTLLQNACTRVKAIATEKERKYGKETRN